MTCAVLCFEAKRFSIIQIFHFPTKWPIRLEEPSSKLPNGCVHLVVMVLFLFSGTTTDLMPSVMGAIDAIWETSKDPKAPTRRAVQANSFANLSPNVQKILANVPDDALNKNFSSEESLSFRKTTANAGEFKRTYIKTSILKTGESLEIISPGVQKMLSNLPDTELVGSRLRSSDRFPMRSNNTFLHRTANGELKNSKSFSGRDEFSSTKDLGSSYSVDGNLSSSGDVGVCVKSNSCSPIGGNSEQFASKPLGSYLHTSPSGIASRTPVGRKNLGKYLQVRDSLLYSNLFPIQLIDFDQRSFRDGNIFSNA